MHLNKISKMPHLHVNSTKRHFTTPVTKPPRCKMSESKIASTQNIGHTHKHKTCQVNFNKLLNEAGQIERVRERKR